MYLNVHSLLRSQAASPVAKNLRHQPTQDVRNFQIVKEQQIFKGKVFLSFKDSCEANRHRKIGGARRDRTDDLLRARQALSQLSYGPPDLPKTPASAFLLTFTAILTWGHYSEYKAEIRDA